MAILSKHVTYLAPLSGDYAKHFLPKLYRLQGNRLSCILIVENPYLSFPKQGDLWLRFFALLIAFKQKWAIFIAGMYWKIYCKNLNIRLLISQSDQVEAWNEFIGQTDLLLVSGIRTILPESLLKRVNNFSINFHYGPLPQYRGTFPVFWQKVNSVESYGYCFHVINKTIDTGPILLQNSLRMPEQLRVPAICQRLICHASLHLHRLLDDSLVPIPQNESAAKYYSLKDFEQFIRISNRSAPTDWINKTHMEQRLILNDQYLLHTGSNFVRQQSTGIFRKGLHVFIVQSGYCIPLKRVNYLPPILYFWTLKKLLGHHK